MSIFFNWGFDLLISQLERLKWNLEGATPNLFSLMMLFILPLLWLSSCYAQDKVIGNRVVGGPCEYKLYAGHAKIISISRAIEFAGSSRKKYEVKFSFTPNLKIEESFAQTEGREYPLLLKNNSYPDQAFLEKYRIEVGKMFDCVMKVIVRGTCTPILFEFPSMRLDDYRHD
jgi:hypothetical protein